ELEEKHKWTLGYLAMTTQLAFENKLSFKAGLKRVTDTTEVLYGIDQVKKARVHVVLDLYGRYALSYN
ncbi:IS3 family transposase, partial [Limosilactobacillus reuteri]|nr:IS3 family transposase [Limosilactobacillus reuteri]